MSSTTKNIPPELIDLMVEQATQGLSGKDKAELMAALGNDPALRDEAEAYELAATAVELSLTQQTTEDLPPALREKLIAAAASTAPAAAPTLKLSGTEANKADTPSSFSFTDGKMFGWYAAIAALVALCLVLIDSNTIKQTTPAQQYAAMQALDSTVSASWGFNADGGDERFANCTGEVIWNGDAQAGYMKLAGLPVNDPTDFQYQLWIVDGSRDTEIENTNRIDGGVFDITATGEVIIPIDAKLLARDAAVFAITVETPGGVVESKGPLQAVAVVDKG